MALNERYEPKSIEPVWQQRWVKERAFESGRKATAPKKYVLEMLPYPSGQMHMGHVRNYLIGDVLARYYAMKGFEVFHPMGWDAFGLPAENAAIKDKVHPAIRTQQNIDSFKKEMTALGYSYDWTKEINTSDPSYYRWNQWFFIKMLSMGLVYRRFSRVNWCTGCLTVIANEQVKDGRCERCDSPVVDKEMPEWAFRITRYSDPLLDGLDQLTAWPDRITSMQRNWIGRSEGAEAVFAVASSKEQIRVFTTRLDTVFGCTYVVMAPDHPLVAKIVSPTQRPEVEAFAAKMAALDRETRLGESAEKLGVFTGAHAINPLSGESVPVWLANFVVSDYGTGAVMSVPAHDARDFAFAQKYNLPIRSVVSPADGSARPAEGPFVDDGILVDSGEFSGLPSPDARKRMTQVLETNALGKKTITYRQRDWGFSRQRYWGTPIPIVYCDTCDPEHQGIPVPLNQLPVKLPDIDVSEVLTGRGEPPLAKVPSFVNTQCPKCNGPARREVETMDTFVDSAWYYARYLSPQFDASPVDSKEANRFLPVDIYVGGPEHAVMHLLYFRFWSRVMKELGLSLADEPVTRLITQGIVNGPDGRKMSKRWGNVVTPSSIVDKYGADTARAYVMFAGPPERDFDWSDDQAEGAFRFLRRVWSLAYKHQSVVGARHDGPFEGTALDIRKAAHKCVKRVTEAIERLSFNTAIAGVMECLNALNDSGELKTDADRAAMAEALHLLALILTPFTPHLSDELSAHLGHTALTVNQPWPTFDPNLVSDDVIPYAVQVNGKLRTEVRVPAAALEAEVRTAAEADPRVQVYLEGKQLRKVVFVSKRLINFVVAG